MKPLSLVGWLTVIFTSTLALSSRPAAAAEVWPDNKGWPKGKPEEVGMSGAALEEAAKKAVTPIGTAIVIRGGCDVWHYGDPYAIQGDGGWASCARSYLTTLFGIAIKEGVIKGGKDSVDLPVNRIDSAAARKVQDAVLLKHLLSYTSYSNPPGSVWRYNKGCDEMFAILQDLYGKRAEVLAKEKLVSVLGGSWEARFNVEQNHLKIHGTAADAARWGYLWLRRGHWKDRQVVDEWFVSRTLEPMSKPGGGFAEINEGWQIHLNTSGKWEGLPTDSFAALGGRATTVIFVCPSLDLVIARRGREPKQKDQIEEFLKPIVDAVREPEGTPKSNWEPATYFPPPESKGGWRKLDKPEDIRKLAGMDPDQLAQLRDWLLKSDKRDFAAVVMRNGCIVLEVERGNSAKTDSRRVASVSKAVCATVLAIASEQSQQGQTPKKMTFDDPAFDFIPWAQPLSDPRKAKITVKQLFNHTSGLCPEANGAKYDGTWEYVLGHTGDPNTAKLSFDPGTGSGYSSHALDHAALVCETVTGKAYDLFATEALFKPLGIQHSWFEFRDGGEKIGRHPTHGLGMPARDLARIAYCMTRGGRWGERQVIPKWFVAETAAPTHDVRTPEMRWKLNPQVFSHGWELPARHSGESGRSGAGIPLDARCKPGSGGQLIAFVPSLDLVITRQTGSSGQWQYEEYLRRACQAVLK